MKILGIETSCDETAIAVVENNKILSNVVASQGIYHAPYGGVVPEIASRHHVEALPWVLKKSLADAQISLKEIDGIAGTYTPGLLGALLVGLQYAKALSFALGKPFIGVNHLEAHLFSAFLENSEPEFPFLGCIVSGGHTHLYLVKNLGDYKLLGCTQDDAAGEAFDKVAKLLNLGYPGGPILDKTAQLGDPKAFRFTKPKLKNRLDFSFSGIKTACLLLVQKQKGDLSQKFVFDLCASFQDCATDFLIETTDAAMKEHQLKNLCVAGGVAANQALRKKLAILAKENRYQYKIPPLPLCTDNGAMIAYVGGSYLKRGQTSELSLNAQAYSKL